MPTYSYYIEEHGDNPENAVEFENYHPSNYGDLIAEGAAKYGFNNNDLCVDDFPLTFVILNEHKDEIGRYFVNIETEITFNAYEKG